MRKRRSSNIVASLRQQLLNIARTDKRTFNELLQDALTGIDQLRQENEQLGQTVNTPSPNSYSAQHVTKPVVKIVPYDDGWPEYDEPV